MEWVDSEEGLDRIGLGIKVSGQEEECAWNVYFSCFSIRLSFR